MNPSAVTLFNWNGKSFIKIITDKRLLRLCVDEVQNIIYAIVIAYSGGYPFSISGDIRSLPS